MFLNFMKVSFLSLFFLLVWSIEPQVWAKAESEGQKIAKKLKAANSGFIGESAEMQMILIDAHGSKITRLMKGKVKEVERDGDKAISIFLNPKDVKGTKMLTWSHRDKDDDQWLYLPTLRRVKRISSRNKSASFMGSEFSYEDLGSQEIEKYTYYLLKEQVYEKHKIWVLKRIPKRKSGYTKQIMYVSKKYKNPLMVEYYDRKDELFKVANFSNYKSFQVNKKNIYRAGKIHMKNVQTKKESIFIWNERRLGVKQKERDFRKSALK